MPEAVGRNIPPAEERVKSEIKKAYNAMGARDQEWVRRLIVDLLAVPEFRKSG